MGARSVAAQHSERNPNLEDSAWKIEMMEVAPSGCAGGVQPHADAGRGLCGGWGGGLVLASFSNKRTRP
jgi:hypothetical protein